jgi:hypothetical protein
MTPKRKKGEIVTAAEAKQTIAILEKFSVIAFGEEGDGSSEWSDVGTTIKELRFYSKDGTKDIESEEDEVVAE